jgi:hypothetical protein
VGGPAKGGDVAIRINKFHSLRLLTGLAALLVASPMTAVPGTPPTAATNELRVEFPARDGTSHPSRGLQQQILAKARRAVPATRAQASADRDLNHIALLEDDGSLLEFIEPGVG